MKTSERSVVVLRLIPHVEMLQQNLWHNSTCRVPALSYTVKALISNEVLPSSYLKWKVALFLAQFNQKLELSSTWCANSSKTLVLKLDFIYSFSKIHQIFQTFLFKVTDGEKLIFHWLLTIILNQSQIIESALTTHSYFNNKKKIRKEKKIIHEVLWYLTLGMKTTRTRFSNLNTIQLGKNRKRITLLQNWLI